MENVHLTGLKESSMSTYSELAAQRHRLQNELQHVVDEPAKQKIKDEIEQVIQAQKDQGGC